MTALRIVAIVLILGGVAGLVAGKLSWTRTTHSAHVGSLDLSVKEKQSVNVPLWAGIAAIVAGAALLLVPTRTA